MDPVTVTTVETPETSKSAKLKQLFTKKRVQHAATAVIAAGATLIVVSKLKDREQAEDEAQETPAEA